MQIICFGRQPEICCNLKSHVQSNNCALCSLHYQIIAWRVSSRLDVLVVMVQKFCGFCDGTSKFRDKSFMFCNQNFEAKFLLSLIKKSRKSKATDTHSEYVIIIAFPRKQWLGDRASVICYFPRPTLFILCCGAKLGPVRLIVTISSTHTHTHTHNQTHTRGESPLNERSVRRRCRCIYTYNT